VRRCPIKAAKKYKMMSGPDKASRVIGSPDGVITAVIKFAYG
jgi:hypothetical protein